jgi:hypothetical protein
MLCRAGPSEGWLLSNFLRQAGGPYDFHPGVLSVKTPA